MSAKKSLLTAAIAAGVATSADASTTLKIGYIDDEGLGLLELSLTGAADVLSPADQLAQKKKKNLDNSHLKNCWHDQGKLCMDTA